MVIPELSLQDIDIFVISSPTEWSGIFNDLE